MSSPFRLEAKDGLSELDEAVEYFHSLMFDPRPKDRLPSSLEGNEKALSLENAIRETRRVLQKMRRGEYDYSVSTKGLVGGLLKALQSNLRHVIWTARCISEGDLSQRIDFMGEFSEVFNLMTLRLAEATQNLKEEAERWRLALESSQDGVWDINIRDLDNPFLSHNFLEILRTPFEAMPPIRRWGEFIHPEDIEALEVIRACLDDSYPKSTLDLTFRVKCGDDVFRWRSAKGQVFRDEAGHITRLIGVIGDIHARKMREEEISRRAMHDALTRLPNRELFGQQIHRMMAYASRTGTCLALAMLDLDNFKQVNDTMGHHAGDLLMVEVGRRLQKSLRQSDLVARIGGDEFVMLLPCATPNHEGLLKVMERLRANLSRPVDLDGTPYSITVSIGLAVYPCDGDDPLTLMKCADVAMYRAKALGRNAWCFWNPEGDRKEPQPPSQV
ncbi:MAG: diguanylate cyclase [Fretibacterium sp.]|nr:diguanylate cyclase [Fretibacterium sp.]